MFQALQHSQLVQMKMILICFLL